MYKKIKKCRLCESKSLKIILKLNATPVANNLSLIKNSRPIKLPLNTLICKNCGHIQLSIVVRPSTLYKSYNYITGISKTFISHFKSYANFIEKKLIKNSHFTIIDIGSNDGLFLKSFSEKVTKIGVEPASNFSSFYKNTKINTYSDFFSNKIVTDIKKKYNKVDVVTANNVFAHIDNLKKIVMNVNEVLKPDGYFIFEVSYFLEMIKSNSFDNIYHEHLSYHTLLPLVKFFENTNFSIVDVINIKTHGGSIRVICKKNNISTISLSTIKLIRQEKLFYASINNQINNLKKNVSLISNKIKNILKSSNFIAYGSPAKCMTFIYNTNLPYRNLQFIVDDNEFKQGKYIPGYNIKIVSSDFLEDITTKYILIFSWNVYKDIIIKNKKIFKNKILIIPLPKLRIIKC